MKKFIKYIYFYSIVFLVCFTTCAVTPKVIIDQDKLSLLENELSRWETFRITGMTELQYQAFSIRGQAILSKASDKFRFDVLNQGILGLGGGVLFAFYIDKDQAQTRMFGSSEIETHIFNAGSSSSERRSTNNSILSQLSNITEFFSDNIFTVLHNQREIILDTHQAEIDGFTIVFTPEMKLSDIHNQNQNLRIAFVYDRQNNLSELRINTPYTRNFIIHIDRIEHENIVVNPLR
ncbi:MAG: hypothetical protein FWG98_03130 [Candidatus Cloacimonetes bacterium]|nr:hypothetical protein [Candidatus Cloacimonadota bacterium]